MYFEKIVNVSDNTEIVRPYTDEEISEVYKNEEIANELIAEIEAKIAARRAVFEKLGLTEEEISLLIG